MPITRMRKNSRNRRSVKRRSYSRNRKLFRSQKMRGGGKKKKGSQKRKRKGSKKKSTEKVGTLDIQSNKMCEVKPEFQPDNIFSQMNFKVENDKFIFVGGNTSSEVQKKVNGDLPTVGATITHLNGKVVKVVDSPTEVVDGPTEATTGTIYVTKFNYGRSLEDIIGITEAKKIYKIRYMPPNTSGNNLNALTPEAPTATRFSLPEFWPE